MRAVGSGMRLNDRKYHSLLVGNTVRLNQCQNTTVEPLVNGHLGDRRKWPLLRGGHCREVETSVNVWNVRQKNGCCREVPIMERWPLVEV